MAIAVEIPEAARRFLDGKPKGLWIDNARFPAESSHDSRFEGIASQTIRREERGGR